MWIEVDLPRQHQNAYPPRRSHELEDDVARNLEDGIREEEDRERQVILLAC